MLEIGMEVEEGLASTSRKINSIIQMFVLSVRDTPNVYVYLLHNKDTFLRNGYILYTLELT